MRARLAPRPLISPTLALLALLPLRLAAGAAPAAPLDPAGLARWLGRRLPEGPVQVALAGGGALEATAARLDGRRAALREAHLRLGPLTATGAVRVERLGSTLVLEGQLSALRLGPLPLGAGPFELSFSPKAGWSGQARLAGGAAQALRLRLAPVPAPCRRRPCPAAPLRLQIEVTSLAVAPALEALGAPAALGLAGALSGQLRLGGAADDLALEASLEGPLRRGEEPLGVISLAAQRLARDPAGSLVVRLAGPLADEAQLTLQAPWRLDALAAAAPRRPEAPPLAAALTLRKAHLAAWTAAAPALGLAGDLDARAVLDGAALGLALEGRDLRWRGEAVGALAARADLQAGIARGSLRWGPAATPHASLGFSLPLSLEPEAGGLRWRHQEPLRIGLRAVGLTPDRLRPFWRAHPAADFQVDLQLDAEGPLAGLSGEGRLAGQLADGARTLPLAAALRLRPQRQQLTASVGAALGLELSTRLPLLALREGRAEAAAAPVEAALRLALPLATLAPYLPGEIHDPRGTLAGAFSAAGTLGAPRFEGEARLTAGALTVAAAAQRLEDVTLSAQAAGDVLRLSALRARSGVGEVTGEGSLRLEATPAGLPPDAPLWSQARLHTALDLGLRQVPFQHPLLHSGLADAALALRATQRPGSAEVSLAVAGGRITLTPVRLPQARAIPSHRQVAVMDWAGRPQGPARLFAGDGRLALTVRLVDPVAVSGAGVALSLAGTLQLERDDEVARVTGGFEVQDGTFTLFEAPFRLRRGRISLQGGPLEPPPEAPGAIDPDAPPVAVALEPVFDWLAEGEVVGTYIDLALRGPARRPALLLASDPPLPEYRILTLLVTGRVDAVDDRDGDVRRQVARLVAQFHSPSLSRQLYDRLGVDKLGLQFKGLTQPVLTVGKQIDRRLYVETVYHHNAPPDANEKEGRAAYRLDPRWTVDTAYGDAAVGSVGVYWGKDFGGPPPARRAVRPLERAEAP